MLYQRFLRVNSCIFFKNQGKIYIIIRFFSVVLFYQRCMGKMIEKNILGIGLLFIAAAILFVMACGIPQPVAFAADLPRNFSMQEVSYTVTPTPEYSAADSGAEVAVEDDVFAEGVDQDNALLVAKGVAAVLATPVNIPDMARGDLSADSFTGKFLNKTEAAKFLSDGVPVTIINVGGNYFDIETDSGERYRIESPVKPKYVERYIDEYGLSDIRQGNGLQVGMEGNLKSSKPPEDIMGVGPNTIGVTPEASDGIASNDVIPVFTLTSASVTGPNDYTIIDEMDYTASPVERTGRKRWFEMYKAQLKGVIWQIFEQSNRYFTMVDKREWDRFTPGYIFSLMQKFEYLIPIPDRIQSIRNPKTLSTEEQLKNRYVLHDYSIKDTSIRVLIPMYSEIKTAPELERVRDGEPSIGYISMTASLTDAELGDGEKFTWNSPIKVVLYVDGNDYTIYMPLQAGLEVNGILYRIPRMGVR